MSFSLQAMLSTRGRSRAFIALLSLGLVLLAPGCGLFGGNGGGGSGTGDGDGDGDGDGTDTTAPAVPSNVSADARDGSVALSWDAVDEADTYNVYRSESSTDGAEGSPLNTDISGTSYEDTDVSNGTTYYYRVTAVDSEGNESDGSGEAQSIPFAAPMALEGTSGDAQVELSWSGGAGAETYSVYRSTSSTDGATGDPLTTGRSETTFTDSTAENGTTYYYRVTSVNPDEEESTASNELKKTPFAEPDRP